MSRKFSIGGKLVVSVCFVAAMVLSQGPIATLMAQQQQSLDDVGTAAEEPQLFTVFSGGALEQIRIRVNDTPQTINVINGAFANLAGATLPWTIPAGDSDLIDVSFNAECALRRNPPAVAQLGDWVEVRAVIFAAPARAGYPKIMAPNAAANGPLALCSGEHYVSAMTGWSDRPTPINVATTYTVAVQWRIVDSAPAGPGIVDAWVDDWKISLSAYN